MKVEAKVRVWYSDGAQELMIISGDDNIELMMFVLATLSDIAAVEKRGIKAITIKLIG